MQPFRTLILRHRALAAVLLALALCIKALIPAGYMVSAGTAVLSLQICADSQGTHLTRTVTIPGKGAPAGEAAKGDGVCAFSVLGHAAAPGADPVQLAAALAFVVALGFAALVLVPRQPILHLRPPLRGPPSFA